MLMLALVLLDLSAAFDTFFWPQYIPQQTGVTVHIALTHPDVENGPIIYLHPLQAGMSSPVTAKTLCQKWDSSHDLL